MNTEQETDVRLCLELLEEYNSKTESEPFDLEQCEKDLRQKDHKDILQCLEYIKELIKSQDVCLAANKILEETKIHGVEYTRKKYGINSFDKKEKWLLGHGFKKCYCNYRHTTTYDYKGYSWTRKEVENAKLAKLFAFKQWYDGIITEKFLNKIIKKLEGK